MDINNERLLRNREVIYETLKQEGYDVIYTREPGGIRIAEKWLVYWVYQSH